MAKILSITSPLVEVGSQNEYQPAVFDRLVTDSQQTPMIVVQRLASSVRCVILANSKDLTPGETVAIDAHPIPIDAFDSSVVQAVVDHVVTDNSDVPCETGILAIDVLCPVPSTGSVCIVGGAGVGRMTMVDELHTRLRGKSKALTIIFPIVQRDAHLVPQAMADWQNFPSDQGSGVSSLWLPYNNAADPVRVSRMCISTTIIRLSPQLAKRGMLPAVDPLTSISLLLRPEVAGCRHCDIVDAIKSLAKEVTSQLEDFEINASDKNSITSINNWKRVENLFAQPFFCRESIDGRSGTYISLEKALNDIEQLLDEIAS